MTAEVNLSDLLNKPRQTLELLDTNRELRLRRRDAEDLVLTTAERAGQDKEALRHVSRLFAEMMQAEPAVMTFAVHVLPAVFPWVRHLPEEAGKEFAAEWLRDLQVAASLDNTAALEGNIAAWKSTAEIYADPALRTRLAMVHDDIEDSASEEA